MPASSIAYPYPEPSVMNIGPGGRVEVEAMGTLRIGAEA